MILLSIALVWLLVIAYWVFVVSVDGPAYTPAAIFLKNQKGAADRLGSLAASPQSWQPAPLGPFKAATGRLPGDGTGPMRSRLRCRIGGCGAERFDQDKLRQLVADGQARIAHLADEVGLAGQQLDYLVLTQAQLAQAVLEVRRGAKPPDANRHPGLDLAQRADFATALRLER